MKANKTLVAILLILSLFMSTSLFAMKKADFIKAITQNTDTVPSSSSFITIDVDGHDYFVLKGVKGEDFFILKGKDGKDYFVLKGTSTDSESFLATGSDGSDTYILK